MVFGAALAAAAATLAGVASGSSARADGAAESLTLYSAQHDVMTKALDGGV